MIRLVLSRIPNITLVALLLAACVTPCVALADSTVVVYPKPSVRSTSTDFTVTAVPVTGGTLGTASSVPTFQFKPNGVVEYSFAQFSFGGTVQVTVTDIAESSINSFSISPVAFAIQGTVNGNTLTFTLPASRYLIVKINSRPELVVAADPLESSQAASGTGIENITMSPYDVSPTSTADSTTQIQNAINAAKAEKGTVYVPAGVYYITRLTLPSNVTLYLAGGSVLRDSGGIPANPDFWKSSLGEWGKWLISTVPGSSNITIRGRGMIDGNGFAMRTQNKYLNTLIMPISTTNFTVDGIVGWNSAFWALTPALSTGVNILNYKGLDDLGTPGCSGSFACMEEDDGIDINESVNVLVKHAFAISRDDNYSTKTWCKASTYSANASGNPNGTIVNNWGSVSMALSNVEFTDVTAWSKDDAFKVGFGICKNQSGVTYDHGYVYSAGHAVDVAGTDYDGWTDPIGVGTIDGITFQNIDIENNTLAWANIDAAPASIAPITNLTYSNINVRTTSKSPYIDAPAQSPAPVDTITFSDIVYDGTIVNDQTGLSFNPASNALTNVVVNP